MMMIIPLLYLIWVFSHGDVSYYVHVTILLFLCCCLVVRYSSSTGSGRLAGSGCVSGC